MGAFQPADIVLIPFPFTDLSQSKLRPALVLATVGTVGNLIVCQITSQFSYDGEAISITEDDLAEGSLIQLSNVRPNHIVTLSEQLVTRRVARLKPERFTVILQAVRVVFHEK